MAMHQDPRQHKRNRHQGHYDMEALVAASPALQPFLRRKSDGEQTIEFGDADAVMALNRALLAQHYGYTYWEIPEGYLCPPVPGRADYLHHVADLLAESNGGRLVKGAKVRGLDIGTGANLIYPLIGHGEYGWRFVGTDTDEAALASAREIVQRNGLAEAIELRHQEVPGRVLTGTAKKDEHFEFTMCNPPFFRSEEDAREANERKWRNLGKGKGRNFGGQGRELWCTGGEREFVRRMINQSAAQPTMAMWFTTLLSRQENLDPLGNLLDEVHAWDVRVIEMGQGQKKSRILAWTWLTDSQRRGWGRRW